MYKFLIVFLLLTSTFTFAETVNKNPTEEIKMIIGLIDKHDMDMQTVNLNIDDLSIEIEELRTMIDELKLELNSIKNTSIKSKK